MLNACGRRVFLLAASAHLLCGQSLNLAIVGTGPIRAGNTIQISLSLVGGGGMNIAALQESLASSVGGTWTVTNGAANAAAGKLVQCSQTGAAYVCVDYGLNANPYSDGIVHTYSLAIPSNAPTGQASVTLTGLVAASASGSGIPITGSPLNFTLASLSSPCDIDGSGATDAADVDAEKGQVLGLAICSADLNGDGKCNVTDLVRVINAALGGACRTGA